MERYLGHEILPAQIWTHDRIARREWIGTVKEPLAVTTESGRRFIPVVLDYRRDDSGDRSSILLPGRYKKEIHRYEEASKFRDNPDINPYIVWDREANVSILAIPFDQEARIFSAGEALQRLVEGHFPQSDVLRRIVELFPGKQFGVLGSWTVLLGNGDSDLDLFVYGGEDYEQVTAHLKDPHVQKDLNIQPISAAVQEEYARRYSQRFEIDIERSRRIALLRNRYESDGTKISVAGCFDKNDYQMQTVLGSRKVGRIAVSGVAAETKNSASFPREYIVELDGLLVRVLSPIFVLQRMVETGDKVIIRGVLREKDGVAFISLEEDTDIIIRE